MTLWYVGFISLFTFCISTVLVKTFDHWVVQAMFFFGALGMFVSLIWLLLL